MQLTNQQVEAMAADKAAIARAKKLAEARNWSGLGASERAIWGECKGSAVYQVRVDLADLASRCSCPSRQLPCKHGLGLLFLAALRPRELTAGAEPEWVADWLDRRRAAAAAKEAKKAETRESKRPVDAAAQAKRADKREERIAEGLGQLDRWLADLVRVGLASVEASSPGIFEEEARRLVDAQAPGLAGWVRRLAGIPLATPAWPAHLLDQLGRLALLSRAYRGLDRLDPALALDVRQLVGWSVSQDEVLAHGDRRRDRWQVFAQEVVDDERLRTQRTWLIGQESGRRALVLQFAPGAKGRFAEPLLLGGEIEAELAFYPGAAGQRALILGREGPPAQLRALAGGQAIAALLAEVSAALARQPWIERFGAVLGQVTPAQGDDGRLHLVDAAGDHLPVATADPYLLLALSGGAPIDVGGEWDGAAFRPFLTAQGGRFHLLQPGLLGPAVDA